MKRIETSNYKIVELANTSNPRGGLLLWARDHGTGQFFLVEKRTSASAYDASLGDTGIAIWHVNASNAGVVALGASTLSFGGSTLWKSGTTPSFEWNNGVSTGSALTISPFWGGPDYLVSW